MAQKGFETSFYTLEGQRISFYLLQELADKVDEALLKYPDIYKSRSHLIRCALVREFRRLELEESGAK